mgnify:FL=1
MKAFALLLGVFTISACANTAAPPLNQYLYNLSQNPKDLSQQYQACLLLGELSLSEKLVAKITKHQEKETGSFSCNTYLLAKQNYDITSLNRFVNAFPRGAKQSSLWRRHAESGYLLGVLPASFKLLSQVAIQDNNALDTLVSGIAFADGGHGEALIEVIAKIHARMPARVNQSFKRMNIKSRDADIIYNLSTHMKGKL